MGNENAAGSKGPAQAAPIAAALKLATADRISYARSLFWSEFADLLADGIIIAATAATTILAVFRTLEIATAILAAVSLAAASVKKVYQPAKLRAGYSKARNDTEFVERKYSVLNDPRDPQEVAAEIIERLEGIRETQRNAWEKNRD